MIEKFIVTKTTWDELSKLGYASVTDYCRFLVENQPNDLPDRIEVYRGDMLCFSVFNVSEAAKWEPNGVDFVKYTEGHGLKARRSSDKPRGLVKNVK